MDCPIVGITTFERNAERHFTLPAQFVECVRRAGGIPVLMPPGEPHLDQWLETVDALLLPSGIDVAPGLYDGEEHETIDRLDPERDRSEVDLVVQAVEAELPLLAVCRGVQVLNVALGGDLFPHLPDCIEDAIPHRASTGDGFGPTPHPVTLDPGSALAALLGETRFEVMSWHHQAIDEVADGLAVAAHAADGVIEAVEMPGHPFLFGVQWHAELTAADDPIQQRLFDGLVRSAQGDL